MKMKFKVFLLFLIGILFVTFYSMVISGITFDEIWEYGWAYNISRGLIPYRDYNMVVTPFYELFLGALLKIFGSYLLISHLFNAFLIVFSIYLIYIMIGKKFYCFIFLLLVFSSPTYNVFITFLMFLFFYIEYSVTNENKKSCYIGLLMGIMCITKQSVGVFMFLITFVYAKNKKKYILSFLVPVLVILIYLLYNNAFFDFFNYCFLGMFDFATKNGQINFWMFFEFFVCLIHIILYYKFKYKELLYSLFFQIIAFPIFDCYHVFLGVRIFIFVILFKISFRKYLYKYFIIWSIILLVLFTKGSISDDIRNVDFSKDVVLENNYLFGRYVGASTKWFYRDFKNEIDEFYDNYDNVFMFSPGSYLLKIYYDIPINKYDIILNGNIGYKGYIRYIYEINDICSKSSCLFIVDGYKTVGYDQTNHEIIDYVFSNYNMLDSEYGFRIYDNKNKTE